MAPGGPARRRRSHARPARRKAPRRGRPGATVRLSMETPVASQSPEDAPAGGLRGLGGGPEGRAHARPSSAATATEACSTFVEGIDHVAHLLPGLMPLARDQERVARLQTIHRAQDRLGAVADLGGLGAALQNRRPDRGGVLGPRVVRRSRSRYRLPSRRPGPSAAVCPDPGPRPRRRRHAGGQGHGGAAPGAPFPARRAYARNRHRPARRCCGSRPAACGRARL